MSPRVETIPTGFVVLSGSLHILHMNRHAIDLLTRLEAARTSGETKWILLAPLYVYCQDILRTMQDRLASNTWTPFHHYSQIGSSTHAILVKGFGLPDRRGVPHSRIVLQLSPHTPESMRGITKPECSDGISKTSQLDTESPQASACE